jgi:hypothetical protein
MHVGSSTRLRAEYSEPVTRLRSIGPALIYTREAWPDYVAEFGLAEEHVGDLIRMAGDDSLFDDDADDDDGDVWAGVHAWRALGQLRAHAAIVPLIDILREGDDDAIAQEMPAVFGMIGPAAIAKLAEFLADPARTPCTAATAMDGLKEIAERHPQSRDACIGAVAGLLEPSVENERETLGFAVSTLIGLAAVETIDAIRAAFARDAIEMSIPGDLEDVEISLGLREHRATPAPRYLPSWLGSLAEDVDEGWDTPVPAPVRSIKIGRNAACPCGSGKKYKKCCLD